MNESNIVWLVDIETLDYVREGEVWCARRKGRSKGLLPKYWKRRLLIGYSELTEDARSDCAGIFRRRVFWTEPHDRNTGDPCYDEGCPCEAVDPRTVEPNVKGRITDRAAGRAEKGA